MVSLNSKRRILIVRLSSIGDILLTTPLVRSLKKQYPDLKIDYCCREEYSELVAQNPYLNDILIYRKEDAAAAALHSAIKSSKYDLVIDLQNNLRSNRLLAKTGVQKVTFKKFGLKKFLLVKFKINLLRNSAQIPIRYARTLGNFSLDEEGLDFFLSPEMRSRLSPADNYIGICPGSRHYTKMWPYDYYMELGEILNLHGYTVVIFGGEREKLLCDLIHKQIPQSINLCTGDSIQQTAADMKMCKVILTNDSGLMHVASALKKPLLAIFGSTVTEFGFSPYKIESEVIENPLIRCRPCSHYGREVCPLKHFNCMVSLTPTMVYQHLLRFLQR